MSTLDSILGLLDKWPKWKRMTAAPDQIAALEQRIAALEKKLTRAPGDACPGCGALEYRAIASKPHPNPAMGRAGIVIRHMQCTECAYNEDKTITPDTSRR